MDIMRSKWLWLVGGVLLGAVIAPKLRSLPVLSSLPTVGR